MSFLDEFPFPFRDANANRLLNLLTTTYATKPEIQKLLARADISPAEIDLDGPTASVWLNVIVAAAAQGMVRQLVGVAASDHPQLFQAFLEDRVEPLAGIGESSTRDIATMLGISKSEPVHDSYFFLIRLGDNWADYPFNWEPFREIAGPLEPPEGALPIVMHSVREHLSRRMGRSLRRRRQSEK